MRRLETCSPPPFKERRNQIFWAGSTTGILSCDISFPCTCDNVPRILFARRAKNKSWLNVSFSRTVQWCTGKDEGLRAEGLLGEKVREERWLQYRGIFDLPGNVDAWGFFWRLASGSAVFQVDSPYVNFFSQKLQDGIHYISLAQDLSDFDSKTSIIFEEAEASVRHLEIMANRSKALIQNLTYLNTLAEVAGLLHPS
mgnify:CR=1 FL=1